MSSAGYQAVRRGPRGLRSPGGVPEPCHVSSTSPCQTARVPRCHPAPRGWWAPATPAPAPFCCHSGDGHSISLEGVLSAWWTFHINVVPRGAGGQEPWRVGGCQPTPLLLPNESRILWGFRPNTEQGAHEVCVETCCGRYRAGHMPVVQPGVLGVCPRGLWSEAPGTCGPGRPSATAVAIPVQGEPVSCALVFGCALRDSAALLPHGGGAMGWWEWGAACRSVSPVALETSPPGQPGAPCLPGNCRW